MENEETDGKYGNYKNKKGVNNNCEQPVCAFGVKTTIFYAKNQPLLRSKSTQVAQHCMANYQSLAVEISIIDLSLYCFYFQILDIYIGKS